jgi:transposase InsO family protein
MIHLRADREWLTASEAAAEELPGCPSKRELQRLMAEGAIRWRNRNASGGGREFAWSDLPTPARAEYLKRYGETRDALPDDPDVRAVAKDLQAEARAAIVAAFNAFQEERSATKSKAQKTFCKAYSARRTTLDAWVHAAVPLLAPHQIALWECKLRRGESLADGRGRPKGTGLFEADLKLRNYTVAAIASRPHLTAAQIVELIRTDLAREIPLRTLQHFLRGFKKSAAPELKALTNPDRARSHHKPAFGIAGARVERINARWEIDASPADAMCVVDGREYRFKLVGLIDVFTRRAMILVSDQVRGVATMALLRRAILAWGLPELVKIDNGKEFKNRAVERFLVDLGIEASFSRPFTPEQKPHIERFFKTLSHQFLELLPGYVGHNVGERQGIEARKSFAHRFGEDANLAFGTTLSPAGLQARIDEWCVNVYAQRHHEGIALRPCDRALAHAGDVRRLQDERALDALMLDAPDAGGLRLVGKSGIRIGNRYFVAGELGEHMGHRVHCRFDPHAPETIVVYNVERTEFLCIAKDRDAMASDELAREACRAQKIYAARLRDIRDGTRKVQRLYPAETTADRLLIAARDGFVPEPQSELAMLAASVPTLVAQRRALAELEAASAPAQPIEATAEERADAEIYFLEEAAAPDRPMQCEGYERTAFRDDELGFWFWAAEFALAGGILDAQDAKWRGELEASESFRDLLNSHLASKRRQA